MRSVTNVSGVRVSDSCAPRLLLRGVRMLRRLLARASRYERTWSWPVARLVLVPQVGVLDGLEVAGGAFNAEPEEVVDAAYVAAGGMDLVQYAVFAQGARADAAGPPRQGRAAGGGTARGARKSVGWGKGGAVR